MELAKEKNKRLEAQLTMAADGIEKEREGSCRLQLRSERVQERDSICT